ncbi:2477_t:CDS:2 [Dentiscutata erythropus]|uniref:2477_t:CDS:1 n=1 Tax=Dentiscutata erythropus TaxID=1348616 RepID=A0A9N9JNZ2_9GLOM|nr:2477_t:CDS:2 [Dentiscutata erythropus]
MAKLPNVDDMFLTLEALEEAAQAAAKAQGFAFSRQNSNLKENHNRSPYIVLQCTKTTVIKKDLSIVWIITKTEYVHNHLLLQLDETVSLPQHRNLSIDQKKLLYELHNISTPTRIITTAINQLSSGGIIMPKDVVNKHARIRYALNEGPNADSAQKLLRLLKQRDYMIEVLKTPDGHLTHLFFSYVEAIMHVAKCPEVLIVDSTYKTNIYKFSLVSAVYEAYGCIPNVFMSDRDQALRNASNKVFLEANKMLCIWHLIEQNLKTNCYKLFDNNDDYLEFRTQVRALHLTFDKKHINAAMNSIKIAAKKARDPQKPLIYIGSLMKDSELWRAIETASGLETVFEAIDQRMRVQHLKTFMHTGNNKIAYDPFIMRNPRFSIILGNISTYAIDKIKRQLVESEEKLYDNKQTCQCLININYKFPYYHIIPKNDPIPLSIIDKRWHLHRPEIKESPVTDPEFYKAFFKAEDLFYQLPENSSVRAEFILNIYKVVTMPLSEPVKVPKITVPKGRPLGTKHEKLMSEKQELEKKKKQKLLNKLQLKQKENNILNSSLDTCDIFKENVPKFMQEHILSYINVHGDGNCGFRAIATSLEIPEDEWPVIRQSIFNELTNRKSHYIQLFLEGETEYNNVISIVQWEKGLCSIDYWMIMPSFGYPIANAFQRPVHYFSRHQCLTFLPDNIPLNRNQSILNPNAPVPVIVRGWQNICSNESKIWERLFENKIARFQEAIKKEHNVQTIETVDLS